jgi:hypothetical protein
MKKKNQKLLLSKQTLSKMGMKNIAGGAASGFLSCNNGGHSKAGQQSCGNTCFVTSCGCPPTVNQ